MTKHRGQFKIDKTDVAILRELQQNSRIPNTEIGRRIGLSQPAVHTRVSRLESLGLIKAYTTIVDHVALGYELTCIIMVTMQVHSYEIFEEFQEHINTIPEVLECYHLTGQYDYMMRVIVRDRLQLENLVLRDFSKIQGIQHIQTHIVMRHVKESSPIEVQEIEAY